MASLPPNELSHLPLTPHICVSELHQPRLWFITGGYLVKRWFIPAAAGARGQSNDLNREILASNLFNCHKEVINAPPIPSISRCIHIVYRHKKVWEYQWSNFIYNCMSTFLPYVRCKDALHDCSAPGGERCESLTWVDEISTALVQRMAYYLFGAKPLSEPILGYCQLPWIGPFGTNFSEILIKIQNFSFTKMHLKCETVAILSKGRWVNSLWPTDTKWHHSSLLIITCWLGTPRHHLG